MNNSFLVRSLNIDVDIASWGRRPVPLAFQNASGQRKIDIGQALHMLGTLTMPNIFSPASPALFWAWIRYYLAPSSKQDFCITMDFADLDPHQKGILSDDFGVAISTKWCNEIFGGLKIVDGRRFILQFPNLIRTKKKPKAKMGPNKCPDFVMKDGADKWHILECKGTQTVGYQNTALKAGVHQKHALRLVGPIRGEQLVSSLFIANELSDSRSSLKVIDPEDDDPILILSAKQADEMNKKADKIALAQSLGAIGLNELAIELSLPTNVDADSELLTPSESRRVRSSADYRFGRAKEQARETNLVSFARGSQRYRGREVQFEVPPSDGRIPFRRVIIRQGVEEDIVTALMAPNVDAAIAEDLSSSLKGTNKIQTRSDLSQSTVEYGNLVFSEMIWDK